MTCSRCGCDLADRLITLQVMNDLLCSRCWRDAETAGVAAETKAPDRAQKRK